MKEEFLQKLEDIKAEAQKALEAKTPDAIEKAKNDLLGRKGQLSALMKTLGKLPGDFRPEAGQRANRLRGELENLFKGASDGTEKRAKGPDLTLPGRRFTKSLDHPFHSTMYEIIDIWKSMGFEIADGPDVDTIYNNYDALNTPPDHPSRTEEDTFYLKQKDLLLRTQTSPVQIRVMKKEKPPIKIIAPGKCYRRDTVDATHYFSFHQVEGLYVDENVSMADLKGVLITFARRIIGPHAKIRFRPHFFPFTEPSVEYDFSCICQGKDSNCRICKGTGWVEISGAGMVDPNVLTNCNLDPEKWSGYAFGMGVERITILKHAINDIRLFYQNDLRLSQ